MSSGKDIRGGGDSVVLAMPRRGPEIGASGAAWAFYEVPARKYPIVAKVMPATTLLTRTFNIAWASALDLRDQMGARFFAMLHDDIEPDAWWVDTLIDEIIANDADAVSVVVPIKTDNGVTSTALFDGDIWLPRRLTMKEVFSLPETFGEEDTEHKLLLNTGCWVADLTKPWADSLVFDFLNRIDIKADGTRAARAVPEDWLASHHMNQHGAKLMATRKVKVQHVGGKNYPNDKPWGDWDHDEVWLRRTMEERELAKCA